MKITKINLEKTENELITITVEGVDQEIILTADGALELASALIQIVK